MTKKGEGLLRWVPVRVNGCSTVQVEVVGMCFDGQALFDLSLRPLFFSAHNLCTQPLHTTSAHNLCFIPSALCCCKKCITTTFICSITNSRIWLLLNIGSRISSFTRDESLPDRKPPYHVKNLDMHCTAVVTIDISSNRSGWQGTC